MAALDNDDPLRAVTPDAGSVPGANPFDASGGVPTPAPGGVDPNDVSQLTDITGVAPQAGPAPVDELFGAPPVAAPAPVPKEDLTVVVGEATDREGTFFFPIRTARKGAPDGKVVYRRYRELESLNAYLHKEFEGCFLPDMPPKDVISQAGRLLMMKTYEETQADLRARQMLIQGYLTPLANHPEIGSSDAMKLFLEAENLSSDPQWMYLAPATKNVIMRTFAAGKEDLQSMLRKVIDKYEPDSTAPEDEVELHQMLTAMQELFSKLSMLETSTNSLLQSWKEDADASASLGCDLSKLFRQTEEVTTKALPQHSLLFEANGDALGASQEFGRGCVAARNALFHGVRRTKGFVENCQTILQDGFMHKQLLGGLLSAFEARQNALCRLQSARREREDLAAQEQLLVEGDQGLTAQKLRNALASAEAGVTVAETAYGRIKERNLKDLGRLRGQREYAFERMLIRFSEAYAMYQAEIAERWVRAAAALGAPSLECARIRANLPDTGMAADDGNAAVAPPVEEEGPLPTGGGGASGDVGFDDLPL